MCIGTVRAATPVDGFTENVSPNPFSAPPPFGSESWGTSGGSRARGLVDRQERRPRSSTDVRLNGVDGELLPDSDRRSLDKFAAQSAGCSDPPSLEFLVGKTLVLQRGQYGRGGRMAQSIVAARRENARRRDLNLLRLHLLSRWERNAGDRAQMPSSDYAAPSVAHPDRVTSVPPSQSVPDQRSGPPELCG